MSIKKDHDKNTQPDAEKLINEAATQTPATNEPLQAMFDAEENAIKARQYKDSMPEDDINSLVDALTSEKQEKNLDTNEETVTSKKSPKKR